MLPDDTSLSGRLCNALANAPLIRYLCSMVGIAYDTTPPAIIAPAQTQQHDQLQQLKPVGFSYSQTDAATLQTMESQFRLIVVAPGNFTAPPTHNAAAYIPLTGFHIDNPSQAAWLERIEEMDGYLRNPAGNKIEDPTGPGTFLIDLRKPQVRAVLHDYIEVLRSAGYQHFFYDAIDSITSLEYNRPADGYQGLSSATADFIIEEQAATDGVTLVNGGFGYLDGPKRMSLWAKHHIELVMEGHLLNSDNKPFESNHYAFVRSLMRPYLEGATEDFTPTIDFLQPHFEPSPQGYAEMQRLAVTGFLNPPQSNKLALRYSLYIPPLDYGTLWPPIIPGNE